MPTFKPLTIRIVFFLLSLSLGGHVILAQPAAPVWQPAPGTSWQWQLSGELDSSVEADMYDLDLFDTPPATIAALQAKGVVVVCYFSAGSFEAWRPDAAAFPAAVKDKKMAGWDEHWLDVRRLDVLAPVMSARLDLAAAKGCDGVEPDNVDGYLNDTGKPLSYADQLVYNRFIADVAHARGLSVGLKNDLEQIPDLEPSFDWALNEQCFEFEECDALLPFVRAGKAVFGVEYGLKPEHFCPQANANNFDWLKKRLELDAYRQACC
ncbi:endo alpha-1,4 polygalactosaminidase [soil metagenome]